MLSEWGVKPPPWLRRLAFFSIFGVFSCVCSIVLSQVWQEYHACVMLYFDMNERYQKSWFKTRLFLHFLSLFVCLLRLLSYLIVLPQVWQEYNTQKEQPGIHWWQNYRIFNCNFFLWRGGFFNFSISFSVLFSFFTIFLLFQISDLLVICVGHTARFVQANLEAWGL